jgi:hypothetical protein
MARFSFRNFSLHYYCTMFFESIAAILTDRHSSDYDRMSVWNFRFKNPGWCLGKAIGAASVGIPESRSERNGPSQVLRLSSLPCVDAKPDHRLPDCRRRTKRGRAPILSLPTLTVFVLLLSFSFTSGSLLSDSPSQHSRRHAAVVRLFFHLVL